MASIADRSVHRTQRTGTSASAVAVAFALLAAASITVGIYLRATQLSTQILLDDEWHAIHKLLHSDVKGIVTSFGVADYSIPLTLYFRFLALHGGLSEWQMHLPMLLAGIALLAAGPWLLRRDAPPAALAAWVALLAISPLLVYLSRTARPYSITCVLAFVAVIAFRNAWSARLHAKAWAWTYAVCTVLAGWLHLVTLPFTLLPFAYYAITALWPRRDGDRNRAQAVRRLAYLGAATAIPLAVVLVPPFAASAAQLALKAGADGVTVQSMYRTALMLFGIASPALLAACVGLCVVGAYRHARRDAAFVAYIGFLCVGAAVAIAAARPQWIQHPLVYARYLLPALPFALLFVAEGAVALVGWLRPAGFAPAALALGAVLLYESGPIPAYLYRPNQFMGHARFQFDYDPAHNPYVLEIPRDPIPAFYRSLAQRPPASVTLIEAPWRLESNFIPFPWYQQVHRQYIRIGLVTPVCGVRDFGEYPAAGTGLDFRYFVHLSEILAGRTYGADYLVMHLTPWKTPPDANVEWPDVAACLPAIAAKLGAPVYRDASIVVFGLRASQ
jgi:hypothetical protein